MNDVMPTVTFCAELAATCAHASFVRPVAECRVHAKSISIVLLHLSSLFAHYF